MQSQPLRWANGDPIIAHGQPVYAFQATPEQFADSNLFNDPYRGNPSSAAWANLNRALAQYGQGQTDSHNGEIAGFKGQTELQQYLRDALGLTVGDVALRDTTLEENFLPLGAPMGKGLSAAASKTAQLTQAVLSGIDAKLTERALQREWRASLADFLTDVAPYESPTPGLPQMGWWGPLDKGVVGSPKGATPVVTAEGKIGNSVFTDVNQTARPAAQANPNQPTLIADRVDAKKAINGKIYPNGNMADAHAEIGVIQKAFTEGKTAGSDMSMNVVGKDVCGYCRGDIAAAANKAGLKSLTIQAKDDITGLPKTYYWESGMKSIREKQ